MGLSLWQIIIILALFIPPLHVLFSSRSYGGAKLGWVLITLFYSWLGYVDFLIVTQPPKPT